MAATMTPIPQGERLIAKRVDQLRRLRDWTTGDLANHVLNDDGKPMSREQVEARLALRKAGRKKPTRIKAGEIDWFASALQVPASVLSIEDDATFLRAVADLGAVTLGEPFDPPDLRILASQ